MKERTTMKKLAVCTAAIITALTVSACSSTESTDGGNNNAETTTTTTTAAPAETEAPAETSAEAETTTEAAKETEPAETSTSKEAETKETEKKETSAVEGTLSDDFDKELDAMIASAEAEIPDIDDILGTKDTKKTETEKPAETEKPEETKKTEAETTTKAPEANPDADTDLKNEHQLVFDGQTYDNTTMTSEGVTKPAGWTVGSSSTGRQFEKEGYDRSYLVENTGKGVTFTIGDAKSNGVTNIPSLRLYKGLTWGATVDDIKAAYGTPVKVGSSDMYGTQLTNLFYAAADGSLIVYEVSSDWGLVVVNCFGK